MKLSDDKNGGKYRLRAVIAENYQEDGHIRQKHIEHLGTIEERYLKTQARDVRAFHKGLFWIVVDKKLDDLKLDALERNQLEAKIAETVSRPGSQWALWGVTCVPKYDR